MRPSGRAPDELRQSVFSRRYTKHAEGSVLVEFNDTRTVHRERQKSCHSSSRRGQGWVTAEYGMLPRAAARARRRPPPRQTGQARRKSSALSAAHYARQWTWRCLANAITIDCDVLQADGHAYRLHHRRLRRAGGRRAAPARRGACSKGVAPAWHQFFSRHL